MANNSKEFIQLQKKWNKKLKDSGFEDIEVGDTGMLKHYASQHFKTKASKYNSPIMFKLAEAYFIEAAQFLHEHKFETKVDRHIWFLHSEGLSVREITTRLKKERFKGYHRTKVHEKIVSIRTQLKEYIKNKEEYNE